MTEQRKGWDAYFSLPEFQNAGGDPLPIRKRLNLVNGGATDNEALDRTDLDLSGGGGGGGTPGGTSGNVQFNKAGTFGGSKSFEIDPTDSIAMRFRGPLRYPGTSPTGGSGGDPKPFGVSGGPTGYTDNGWGATHCLPFAFSTFNGSGIVKIDTISGKHNGLIQIVALGVIASGAKTTRILIKPYSCSSGGVITLGSTIDQTPAALISADPTLVLGITGENAGGDSIPYIVLGDGGDGAEDVRWSGQVQLTMTKDP